MVGMVFDIGRLRVKLIFSCGNYDKHSNKRKIRCFGAYFDNKKLTHACIVLLVYHSNRRVALASMNMNVFKTRFLMKPLITLVFATVQFPYF